MEEKRELATQTQATEIARPQDNKIPDEILQVAATLHAMALEGGGAISKAAAIRAAQYMRDTGETIGRDVYLSTKGKTAGQLLDGYQGVQRRVKRDYYVKYRRPTPEEMEDHEMDPKGRALVCEVYVYDLMERARRVGVPYEPVIGVCYYGPGEEIRVLPTKTKRWVLEKNALKDALRKVAGVPTTLGEALDMAEEQGVDPELLKELDGITPQQAVDYVDAVKRNQKREDKNDGEPEDGFFVVEGAARKWQKMCRELAASSPFFALDAPDKPNMELIVKLVTQVMGFHRVDLGNIDEIKDALIEYHESMNAETTDADDDDAEEQADLFGGGPKWD